MRPYSAPWVDVAVVAVVVVGGGGGGGAAAAAASSARACVGAKRKKVGRRKKVERSCASCVVGVLYPMLVDDTFIDDLDGL